MAVIASSMQKEASFALKNLDCAVARSIIETDAKLIALGLYCKNPKVSSYKFAYSQRSGLKQPKDCLGYRLIANP
jgi:hypothetical protein